MDSSDSGNQQLLAIKQFFIQYSRIIVVGVVVLCLIIFGGHYWKKQRQISFANASLIYQEMVLAELQSDIATAKSKGDVLISEYAGTPYAVMSALLLAKIAVVENNLDVAAEKLTWVIKNGNANPAKHLANTRLAAVLQQQNKLDEALALVSKDPDPAYITLYAQARGDIYVAKGDLDKAREAYVQALQNLPQGTQAPLLQMKLLDTGGGQPNA